MSIAHWANHFQLMAKQFKSVVKLWECSCQAVANLSALTKLKPMLSPALTSTSATTSKTFDKQFSLVRVTVIKSIKPMWVTERASQLHILAMIGLRSNKNTFHPQTWETDLIPDPGSALTFLAPTVLTSWLLLMGKLLPLWQAQHRRGAGTYNGLSST